MKRSDTQRLNSLLGWFKLLNIAKDELRKLSSQGETTQVGGAGDGLQGMTTSLPSLPPKKTKRIHE